MFKDNSYLLRIFFAAFAIAIAFQGARGLYETSEGRYAECGREMVATGKWLIPTLDGHPHWTKPPLTYWAIAAGIYVFGVNEFAVRFYLVLAFAVSAVGASLIAKMMWGKRAGIIAGFAYATSVFPAAASNMVTTDALLTMWDILAVAAYLAAYSKTTISGSNTAKGVAESLRNERSECLEGSASLLRNAGGMSNPNSFWERYIRPNKFIVLMWAFFGFAFLTKGPPGLIPLAAIIPFHYIRARKESRSVFLFNPIGLALFAVLAASWYLTVNALYPGLLERLAGDEIVKRVSTDKYHRNPAWYMPFVIYLPIMLFGAVPWAFLWIAAAKRKFPFASFGDFRARAFTNSNALFLLMWAVIPAIIFSLFKSRLALYLLPYMAPVVIASARLADIFLERGMNKKWLHGMAIAAAALIIAAKAMPFLYPPTKNDMRPLYETIARETAGKNYNVSLFQEKLMWGLQFYENRHIDRIAFEKSAWGDMSLNEKIAEIEAGASATEVIVSHPDRKDKLAKRLEKAGLKYRVTETRAGWFIFLVE